VTRITSHGEARASRSRGSGSALLDGIDVHALGRNGTRVGELGRAIAGVDRDAIVAALLRAYADEWFAQYNFQYVANTLRGHRSPSVPEFLRRRTAEALARANRLAARLEELGARPPAKLGDLERHASEKPFKLPASMADVDGVLRAVLDAERTSVRTYRALHDRAAGRDPLTERLAVDLLAAAVANEEEIERLLGDPAPAMDGR
jgi:bacterioferritin